MPKNGLIALLMVLLCDVFDSSRLGDILDVNRMRCHENILGIYTVLSSHRFALRPAMQNACNIAVIANFSTCSHNIYQQCHHSKTEGIIGTFALVLHTEHLLPCVPMLDYVLVEVIHICCI